jgi:hypothetical protein
MEQAPPLPEGTEVLVTPVPGAPGSAVTVLAAVENSPAVPAAWVDELEQIIAEGRRPPTHPDLFPNEPGSPESQ